MRFVWPLMLIAVVAQAKQVTLRWEDLPGATAYEIQVLKGGKVVVNETANTTSTKWKRNLTPGVYQYQIRGLDFERKPGKWTDLQYLVVPPDAPEITSDSDQQYLFSRKLQIELKWESVPLVDGYFVEMQKEGKIVLSEAVKGTSKPFHPSEPGQYSWTVKATFDRPKDAPATETDLDSHLGGAYSEKTAFIVTKKNLEKPTTIAPIGSLEPPPGRRVVFEWKPVEGADLYLFTLKRRIKRELATKEPPTFKKNTKATKIELLMPADGEYFWTVRALAGVSPQGEADFQSEEAKQAIYLSPESRPEYAFQASLSNTISSYNYKMVSSASGFQGSTSALASGPKLEGDYVPKNFGVGLSLEDIFFSLDGHLSGQKDFVLRGIYRLSLGGSTEIRFEPGFGLDDYLELNKPAGSSLSTPSTATLLSTIGPGVRLELIHHFSRPFSILAQADYYYPISLVGSFGARTLASGNTSNFDAGLEGKYSILLDLDLVVGAEWKNQQLYYAAGGPANESLSITNLAFFGGLILYFGH